MVMGRARLRKGWEREERWWGGERGCLSAERQGDEDTYLEKRKGRRPRTFRREAVLDLPLSVLARSCVVEPRAAEQNFVRFISSHPAPITISQ